MSERGKARAYIAGVLHGDGYCTARAMGLHCKDKDFTEAFASAVNLVFDLKCKPVRSQQYWRVVRPNKDGRYDSAKGYSPRSAKERALWLRGLFDSEGNAQLHFLPSNGPRSYHRRVAFYSTSRHTLNVAAGFLATLGIAHSIRSTKNSATHIGTLTVFELRLCRREAFQSFSRVVGSSIGRKQTTLNRISSTYLNHSRCAREAQLKGAKEKHRRLMELTLPRVALGVHALIASGVTPTQRNCHQIPGFYSIQRHVPQAALVAMAQHKAL